ncbi:MAG: SDR family oxidoreductase [Burkholderiales bacterium]|nr:SDR family oxidoreductase [Anaerolineae bacterium]
MMKINLTDQVALVTGSAHRVGKAIALELARNGVHIMVHYNGSGDEATETLREIKSHGVEAFSVQANVGTPEGVETIFAAVREHFGRLNILVNSASNFGKGNIADLSLEDWQETLDINLSGPFLCTQQAARLMRENDPSGGAIVNICDKGSLEPWHDRPHHSVSKAGLYSLSMNSALNLAPDIRVNVVIPGPVMKPQTMSNDDWAKITARAPLKRAGSGDDVARAVAYLVSEDFLTGTVIHVTGGEHLL